MRIIMNSSHIADLTARIGSFAWWQKNVIIILCMMLLLVSAFSVVVTKNQYREKYVNYQGMIYHQQQLNNQYAQLMLEKGAFSTQMRVMQVAHDQLHMFLPPSSQVVMVTE